MSASTPPTVGQQSPVELPPLSLSVRPSGPSHVVCPLSLLFSGFLMPRCQASPILAFPRAFLIALMPLVLCSEVPLPESSFQFRGHLLSEAFSHLSSWEELLARHDTSESPRDRPSGLRTLTDIDELTEAP